MSVPVPAKPSRVLVNVLVYQAGWFACVLSAARHQTLLGMGIALAIAGSWLLVSPRPGAMLRLILLTGVVGYCWDSWLSVLGLMGYSPDPLAPPLAPLWILALWLLFAITLPVALRWLQPKLALAALLGALAAPLAYYAAARFGALSMPRVVPALGAEAAGWALLLPVLLSLARRLDA